MARISSDIGAAEVATSPVKNVNISRKTTVHFSQSNINERIVIGDNGEVAIIGKDKTLFLNFGQTGRANDFLATRLGQGMKDSSIKSFEVSQSFLDKIRSEAIRERDVKKFPPGRPIRVDVKKADDQFGLHSNQIEELEKEIIKDSGKVYQGPIEGGEQNNE